MAKGIPGEDVVVNLDCGGRNDVAQTNEAGWPFGGTELRCLTAHDDKLFAGTGLWMDDPPTEDVQNPGPVIMRLDGGNDDLVIEHSFRGADTAVCLLYSAWFADAKKTVFVSSTWNSRFSDLYTRDYPSKSWHFAQCLQEQPDGGPSMQIRSAITYTDPIDGVSRLFLGQSPSGVFSLAYDEDARGGLGKATLEFDMAGIVSTAGSGNARVMSFDELGGHLYCTVFNRLYKRENGGNPCWHLVHEDPDVGNSESGFRGLTAVADGTPDAYFFVARESGKAAILKLVPSADRETWTQTVVYDIDAELTAAWTDLYGGEVKVSYGIAAYNNMIWFQPPGAKHWALWVGLEAGVSQYPASFPVHAGVDGAGNEKVHAAIGSFLVWNFQKDGRWILNQLPQVTSQPMVATRCGLPAPFPGGTRFYVGGFDCNSKKAHNTAYLVSFDAGLMIEDAVA